MNNDKHKILEAGLRGKELLLKGVIIPGDKDEHSAMASIVLSTDKELDFVIERDPENIESRAAQANRRVLFTVILE